MSWRRAAFLVAGTLVLWYLGHFALRAAWTLGVFGDRMDSRWLDLALLPVAAAAAWLVARRLDWREGKGRSALSSPEQGISAGPPEDRSPEPRERSDASRPAADDPPAGPRHGGSAP